MSQKTARNVPPKVARARSSLGRKIQLGASPDVIEDARRELKAASLGERIREAVSTWPPLSERQRAGLAVQLLNGGSDG